MANVNADVRLDNYSQSGDQTLQQMQNDIYAATGVHPGVAEQVRDPVTSKLIKVVLTMPESASANAAAKISANKGVSTCVIAAPQLMLDDLHATDGIELSTQLEAGGIPGIDPIQDIQAIQVVNFGATLGTLHSPTGAGGNTFVDGTPSLGASPVIITLYNGDNSGPFVIPAAATFRLRTASGLYFDLVRTNDIVVPTSVGSGPAISMDFYVASDGKMYLFQLYDSPNVIVAPRTYEEAVQFPPA